MARLPRFSKQGEREFARICADAGIICQKVEEDESGWDYLIEFPTSDITGPGAEDQTGGVHAYVQVKSTTGKKLTTKVSVSNALRSVQHSSPWFIVLFTKTDGEVRIYSRHVIGDLLADCLKATRYWSQKKRKLNKQTLAIDFTENDEHTSDLVDWIESEIAKQGDYEAAKKAARTMAGYENGAAKIRFQTDTVANLDPFVLSSKGLAIRNFSLTPERFGIPDAFAKFSFGDGIVKPTERPVGPCLFRVRAPNEPLLIILGEAFDTGWGAFDSTLAQVRFKTPVFSIRATSNDARFDFENELEHPLSVRLLGDYSRLRHWISRHNVEISVDMQGERVLSGILERCADDARNNWDSLHKICTFIVGKFPNPPDLLLDNLISSANNLYRYMVLDSGDFAIEADDNPSLNVFEAMLGYSYVVCGTYAFALIIRREVRENRSANGRMSMDFHQPTVLQAICEPIGNCAETRVRSFYEEELARASMTMGVGNYNQLWRRKDLAIDASPDIDERRPL